MIKFIAKMANLVLKIALPLTAFLVPLFFLPITTDFFGLNKQYLVAIIATLCVVSWLIKNLLSRKAQISLTPATIPLLLLSLAYIFSSLLQSSIPFISLIGKTTLIVSLCLIFLTVTTSEKDASIAPSTFSALIASAVVISILSLLSLTESLPATGLTWLSNKNFNLAGGLVPHLSFSFALLPAAIYLALITKRPVKKVFFLASSALLIITSIAQINYLISLKPQPIYHLPLQAGWSITLDILKNWRTALLGSGPETFINVFTRFRPLALNLGNLWNVRFTSSSNEILEIATTVGLLGVLFFLAALYRSLRPVFRQVSPPLILVITSFIAMLILPASVLLYAVLFIGLTLLNLGHKTKPHLTKEVSLNLESLSAGRQAASPSLFFPLALALVILPLLAYFWYTAGRVYYANTLAFKGANLISTNTTKSYDLQIKAYQLDPRNSAYRVNFSLTSLALANNISQQKNLTDDDKKNVTQLIQQAIREGKNATELDPENVMVWENLSNIYRQLLGSVQGAQDWAIASYSQAVSLDPNNPILRLELGGIFFALKDYDQAARYFETAISLKPNWPNAHYNLATLYREKKAYSQALAEMTIVKGLIDPNSDDAKKVDVEIKALEKLAPAPTPTPTPAPSK